eukprot:m.61450 g.61450  ORF g.61450 m.61450 type:complete len:297 (-) comp13724_c0_seq1:444-1334(-)
MAMSMFAVVRCNSTPSAYSAEDAAEQVPALTRVRSVDLKATMAATAVAVTAAAVEQPAAAAEVEVEAAAAAAAVDHVAAVTAIAAQLTQLQVTAVAEPAPAPAVAPAAVAPVVAAAPAPAPAAPVAVTPAEPQETCQLCDETVPESQSILLGDDSLTAEHYLKQEACYHRVCAGCMGSWVAAQLSEQFFVRCPMADCKYKLYNEEIRAHASTEDFERLLAFQIDRNLARNGELADLATSNPELKTFLDDLAKPCPHCFLMIERSEGCNFMLCVCGGRFCWLCGQDCEGSCEQSMYA